MKVWQVWGTRAGKVGKRARVSTVGKVGQWQPKNGRYCVCGVGVGVVGTCGGPVNQAGCREVKHKCRNVVVSALLVEVGRYGHPTAG